MVKICCGPTSCVVENLIYHGKLANQIARLAAIVVKNHSKSKLLIHGAKFKVLFSSLKNSPFPIALEQKKAAKKLLIHVEGSFV